MTEAALIWVLDIGEIQTRYTEQDALLARLAEMERQPQGRVSVLIDRGPTTGWLRFLGGAKRDVTPCVTVEWIEEYASLIFYDDAWSEYRAIDRERPVAPAETLRLQIAHGEPAPHPTEECMEKRRAFEAVRQFMPRRSRPDWLTYRYVP